MKIIIPLVGSFGKSGGFRVLSQLANHWIKDGHEVSFLCYIQSGDPYFPTQAEILYYNNAGILSKEKDLNQPKALLGMFTLRRALRKALDTLEADVVLANHCFTAMPVKKSVIKARKFYYVQAYEPEYYYHNTVKDFIYKKISKNSYSLGLNIIVNASMYQNYYEIKTNRVVFPGLDLSVFKPVEEYRNDEKIILGTIARSEEYKGTKYVVEAFKNLRKKLGNKVELHLAFGEPSLEEIDGVKVVFPDGDLELAKYYNSLNIYICAGTVQLDAIHYPVLESMACKIPVITTGYYPASTDNAYLVPIKDPKAIEEAVSILIRNPDKNKQQVAYQDIQSFRWEFIARKMMNYFNE